MGDRLRGAWQKMKPRAKQTWVKALRSGEYEQGRGFLCDASGRMCCLGVAIDSCVDGEWTEISTHWMFDDNSGQLSLATARKLGIAQREMNHLIVMNDSQRASFAEIADWIEENL